MHCGKGINDPEISLRVGMSHYQIFHGQTNLQYIIMICSVEFFFKEINSLLSFFGK